MSLKFSLLFETDAWVISLVLFCIMILSIWLGLKTGKKRKKHFAIKGDVESSPGIGHLTGLLFFLMAFTFGMSGSRFDTRRQVVVEEANIIGTAILRADLYPPTDRMAFRNDFKAYVEARIDYYQARADVKKILDADSLSQAISTRLWVRATQKSLESDATLTNATRLMIPALNDLIDITTTRLAGEKAKVPESILWMLIALACISAFYNGYAAGIKGRVDWMVEIGFCLLVAVVVLFTLDLDRPRRGFVTLDSPNQTIIDLRKNFR